MLGIFRVVAGLIFLTSGTTKLFGYPVSPVEMPPIDLMSQVGIGGMLEVVGGLAVVIGLFTRPCRSCSRGAKAVRRRTACSRSGSRWASSRPA